MAQFKNINNLKQSEALELCQKTEDIDTILQLTMHQNSLVRKKSLFQICPCRVKGDISLFWERIFEMVDDPDPIVRDQVNNKLKTIYFSITV